MKNKSTLIIALAIVMSTIFSCAQNNKKDILEALGTECDTTETGYALNIKPILDQHCSTPSCHSPITIAGGYNLSEYTTVRDAVLGPRLLGTIEHAVGFSPMPKGSSKLTDCDIEKITIWARKGAQNN